MSRTKFFASAAPSSLAVDPFSSPAGSTAVERRREARRAPAFRSKRKQKLVEGLTRAEIAAKYASKVRFVAERIAHKLPRHVDVDELVSVGFMGLMDAADRFESERGYQFGTYAEFRIRGAILDELRSQDWVPRRVRDKAKEMDRAREMLEKELGRKPTDREIAAVMGLSTEAFQRTRDQVGSMSMLSYDDVAQLSSADRKVIHSRTREDSTALQSPLEQACKKELQDTVQSVLRDFPERERKVLNLYYFRGLNFSEIAQILEISNARVCQLHTRAMNLLRQTLTARVKNAEQVFQILLED